MKKTYIVYLDEFGHVGPYIAADHKSHNTHPAFGLGGFVLPIDEVRSFSSFFFSLKQYLFEQFDIPEARRTAQERGERFQLSTWEKKGSKHYSVANLQKYKGMMVGSTNRIINTISRKGGFLLYVGEVKQKDIDRHNPQATYSASLSEIIKRIDDEFKGIDANFLIFMDDSEGRSDIVKRSIYEMHQNDKYQLIEAPMQVDSKLYQTIQCADWLCSIYGKIEFFNAEPESKPQYEIFKTYFGDRIQANQKRSNVRNTFKKKKQDLDSSLQKLCRKYNTR